MKKKVLSLILSGVLLASLGLSSCENISSSNSELKSVISASLNEKGELILTYSDNTTQNLGVVKGENGKDGEDLVACVHTYDEWTTVLSPTCTSIGYSTRTCSFCGDLDYQFIEATGHTYNETTVDVVNNCKQHFVNKSCKTCGDTTLVEAKVEHNFGDGSVCIDCGIELWQTHFIESEEYIEISLFSKGETSVPLTITWWNYDKTYGFTIARAYYYDEALDKYICGNWVFAYFVGTPINAMLPKTYRNEPIRDIGTQAGGAFGCTPSLKSVIIPKTVAFIGPWSFGLCTSLSSVFLEGNPQIDKWAFYDCDNMTLYRYSENEPTEEGNYWHYVNGEPVIWGI